ncbi:hypothetical protein PGT21_005645 [Puccinia graminis f. sp. tritici]|uniref:Uncharacterized protein n=1 Tax=Puccinia graminis f. sp. tritici TaxID=56615 RepID=A0A5B0MAH6_PUCGR|nr:hypothetical protein PGT21_005645 [Puccinia graminis f. sp. tritici]
MDSTDNFSLGHHWTHHWNTHGLEVTPLRTHITSQYPVKHMSQPSNHLSVMLIHSSWYTHNFPHLFISTAVELLSNKFGPRLAAVFFGIRVISPCSSNLFSKFLANILNSSLRRNAKSSSLGSILDPFLDFIPNHLIDFDLKFSLVDDFP